MWYIYAREYYSAMKKDGIESCVEMQMDLDSVTQSEVSQKEKKNLILMNTCGIFKKTVQMSLFVGLE